MLLLSKYLFLSESNYLRVLNKSLIKKLLFSFLICCCFNALANGVNTQNSDKPDKKKLPPLGNCSEDTDYKIYKCQAFSCKLPVISDGNVTRNMEVIGYDVDLCLFNYSLEIRHKNYPSVDFRFRCRLSSEGVLEMANQFSEYKNGNLDIYNNPPYNETLTKECSLY
jgi:hypothetical protein